MGAFRDRKQQFEPDSFIGERQLKGEQRNVSEEKFLTREVSADPQRQTVFDPQDNPVVAWDSARQRHGLAGHHHQVLWLLGKHGLCPCTTGEEEIR